MKNKQYLAFAALLLVLDQSSKKLALETGYANLNTNLALNIEFSYIPLLSVITIIALIALFYRLKNKWIGLIIVGGVSNLLDRFTVGGVIDFIRVLNFPIFNLADIFIVIGIIFTIKDLFNNVSNKYHE